MSVSEEIKLHRVSRWYFGGVAATGAAAITHPLELLKVHLQTVTSNGEMTLLRSTLTIVKQQGVLSLYSGLTAGMMVAIIGSTTRFGIYETIKLRMGVTGKVNSKQLPFLEKVLLSGFSGTCAAMTAAPAGIVNARMQNDVKLAPELRRNYKNVFHGWYHIIRHEGFLTLYTGITAIIPKAAFGTIGQLAVYDQVKYGLLKYCPSLFKDNMQTHFTASFIAGGAATALIQPFDTIKVRMQNARSPSEFRSATHCASLIVKKFGPMGLFKGFWPAFVRIGPGTILTFVFFEQLRLNFGNIIF